MPDPPGELTSPRQLRADGRRPPSGALRYAAEILTSGGWKRSPSQSPHRQPILRFARFLNGKKTGSTTAATAASTRSSGPPTRRESLGEALTRSGATDYLATLIVPIIDAVDMEETLTPLNLAAVIEETQPELVLFAAASEDLGLGNAPGVGLMMDSLREEIDALSEVPVLELARRMGAAPGD